MLAPRRTYSAHIHRIRIHMGLFYSMNVVSYFEPSISQVFPANQEILYTPLSTISTISRIPFSLFLTQINRGLSCDSHCTVEAVTSLSKNGLPF